MAQPLFRGGLHESFVSISCEIVGEAFVRSVISEVHAPGNDGIQFYSVAFGRRNSLQEGFFAKLGRGTGAGRYPFRSLSAVQYSPVHTAPITLTSAESRKLFPI